MGARERRSDGQNRGKSLENAVDHRRIQSRDEIEEKKGEQQGVDRSVESAGGDEEEQQENDKRTDKDPRKTKIK